MSQVITFEDYQPTPRFDDIPWTQARIDEGDSSTGPWNTIDTITLDPVDTDPSHPAVRSFTTELASDAAALWYRIVFLDASADQAQPTDPIQNVAPAAGLVTFATAADLATRLGISLTSDEQSRATALLALASGLIQDVVGQTIALVTDDTLSMPGTPEDRIELPQKPVVSVTSVSLDEVALTEGSDWYLDGSTIFRRAAFFSRDFGILDGPYLLGSAFGTPLQTLTIVYTHGYTAAEIPATVKSICLEAVVRCFVNPGAVARKTVGNTSTVYDNMRFSPSGLILTDDERRTLKRRFGARALSVPIHG